MTATRLILAFTLAMASMSSALANQQDALGDYRVEEVAGGLAFPWSLAFLPDGSALVSERNGGLVQLLNDGSSRQIEGLPEGILVAGQGGLHEVLVHPDFAENQLVFLSYAYGSEKNNSLRILRARLLDSKLIEQQVIFTVTPFKNTPVHFGGRMAWQPDGTLVFTSGDGFDYREDAQRLPNQLGKILRINADGSIPADNPFVSHPDPVAHAVYSYGHRNPQGIVYDAISQRLYSHEHGPAGGDEINHIVAGNNYGWPVITYGKDYSGASISPFTEYTGMQQPLVDWTPSIAPSGMAIYQGEMFLQLQGDLLVTSLKDRNLHQVRLSNNKLVADNVLLAELEVRLRDVRVHQDGSIYLLTDESEGKVLRVVKD